MKLLFKKIALLFLYEVLLKTKRRTDGLMVLTYHRVSDEPELGDPLKVSLSTFERQLLFLKKNYNIISAEELAHMLRNGEPYPDNACLITFDDGWRDNYTRAYPLLKKYGVPALIFLSTDYIGTNEMFWHEELKCLLKNLPMSQSLEMRGRTHQKWPAEIGGKLEKLLRARGRKRGLIINDLIVYLKNYAPDKLHQIIEELRASFGMKHSGDSSMLSWGEVNEMSENNIFFGSHTKSHTIFTQIRNYQIIEEIEGSKRAIEESTGKAVHFLSYPNGNYVDEHIDLVRESGYLGAFTCSPGHNYLHEKQFELRRNHINENYSLNLEGNFSDTFFAIELSCIRHYWGGWRSQREY